MKANLLCEALRAARLFEPDRNEEKWTNEHVYWEQRMSNFFYKRTNNIEVKNTKLPAEKTNKPRTSQETLSFYDWLLAILNYLHACVCFDRVCLSLGIVFCSVYWNSFGDYNRIRWVNVVQIVGYNTFVLVLDFSSDRSDPIQVVSNLLPLKSYRNCT